MIRSTVLAVLLVLAITTIALGADPVTIVKHPCEEATYRVTHMDCAPPCAKCPGVDLTAVLEAVNGVRPTCPPPVCPPPVCGDCDCSEERIHVFPPMPPPAAGHWFALAGLLRVPSESLTVSYFERLPEQHGEDPRLRLDQRARLGAGLGLGYRWASGFALSGEAFILEKSAVRASWKRAPRGLDVWGLDSAASGSRLALAVTAEIPLGHR